MRLSGIWRVVPARLIVIVSRERMTPSAHLHASASSQELCDELFAALAKLLPELKRNQTKGSCGVWQAGKARFAYVYHSKTKTQIEIWCRGDKAELLRNDPGLNVRPRQSNKPGWEESFPARFTLLSAAKIPVAAKYLTEVSSRAAAEK